MYLKPVCGACNENFSFILWSRVFIVDTLIAHDVWIIKKVMTSASKTRVKYV